MSRLRRVDDRGSVTLVFVVFAVALLAAVGLIIDGGHKIRAAQEADSIAAEAARYGGQAIDASTVIGGQPVVDPGVAVAAAQQYLASAGVTGLVSIQGGGTQLVVSTHITRDTVFLDLIGIGTVGGDGYAVAELIAT